MKTVNHQNNRIMKKIVVLIPKAYEEIVSGIFSTLKVPVFSKMDIEGYKNGRHEVDVSNWFARGNDYDFSVMFFAFVTEDIAHQTMDAISSWNKENQTKNPMHAYMVSVERSV